jgi:hypothetical protein
MFDLTKLIWQLLVTERIQERRRKKESDKYYFGMKKVFEPNSQYFGYQ